MFCRRLDLHPLLQMLLQAAVGLRRHDPFDSFLMIRCASDDVMRVACAAPTNEAGFVL
jgi:hypothetical protein